MAYTISKKEPVSFGGLELMPEVNAEKRLRLEGLKITEDNLDEARALLASCFGEHQAEVSEFMAANMFMRDYLELQVFLLQGSKGLDAYRSRVEKMLDEKMHDAMKDLGAKNA